MFARAFQLIANELHSLRSRCNIELSQISVCPGRTSIGARALVTQYSQKSRLGIFCALREVRQRSRGCLTGGSPR